MFKGEKKKQMSTQRRILLLRNTSTARTDAKDKMVVFLGGLALIKK